VFEADRYVAPSPEAVALKGRYGSSEGALWATCPPRAEGGFGAYRAASARVRLAA